MKHRLARLCLSLLCCTVCLRCGGMSAEALSTQSGKTNCAFWADKLCEYRDSEEVRQLLFVRYQGESKAAAQFYEKADSGRWKLVFETAAYVGREGIGKTQEGDGKTPTGDFGIRRAFGILPNPGTALEYIDIGPDTYACDENGVYYNQIVDTALTGHECSGEQMAAFAPYYNYGIETDYNAENIYPKGSEIFIHSMGPKESTGGCVALDEEHMKLLLCCAGETMRVIIDEY